MEKIREILYSKFYTSTLSEENLDDALSIVKQNRNKKRMKFSIENLYLYSGISFLLSSVLYFVAYNLKIVNDTTKIILMYLAVTVPFILYLFNFKEKYKKLVLFSLCFLIGVLFAVFGQIYQTGADSYWLFVTWALGITPLVLVSQFSPCYILHFLIIYIATVLFGVQNNQIILVSVTTGVLPILFYVCFYSVRNKLSIDKWYFNFLIIATFVFHTLYTPIIGTVSFGKSEFFISFLLYLLVMGYFQLSKEGVGKNIYTKIISLVPFFTIIPVGIANILKGINYDFGSVLLILGLIIGAYMILIKRISYIRGGMSNE